MALSRCFRAPFRARKAPLLTIALSAALGMAGCGGQAQLKAPVPRPIVVTSGERLRVSQERMDSIYQWLTVESKNIQEDPTFLINGVPTARETQPWATMTITGDTAKIQYDRAHPDITTAYDVYAHLHLMKKMGKLEDWLPGHAEDEGYALEHAIVDRMADAWLLGRAAFDAPPYSPLDELVYAKEAGYLNAYLLVARSQDFAAERTKWEQDKPGELETYRTWFKKVFNREPPGLRETATAEQGK